MFPEYLRDVLAGGDEVAFRDRGPQLSRGSRALKLWLSVHAFGLDAFRAAIARGIELAERAQAAIERPPNLEVVTPAQLGIVTFAPAERRRGRARRARRRRRLRRTELDRPARAVPCCACARSTRAPPTRTSTRTVARISQLA